MPPKPLPNRRSIRLSNYDYSMEGAYFITLVCQDRTHFFGKIIDGKMILNALGKIAQEEWMKTPNIRPNTSLGEFIIMPDHMHMILHIDSISAMAQKRQTEEWLHKTPRSPSQTIGAIIRGFKGATTKRIKIWENDFNSCSGELPSCRTGELQFAPTSLQFAPTSLQFSPKDSQFSLKIWQRNYYEHIIRDQRAYENISNYILKNPENWQKKEL